MQMFYDSQGHSTVGNEEGEMLYSRFPHLNVYCQLWPVMIKMKQIIAFIWSLNQKYYSDS